MGPPPAARVSSARSGDSVDWAVGDGPLPAAKCPDLITVSWELGGVEVTAKVDVVSSRYCTLNDIRTYRSDEYLQCSTSDESIWNARAWAEERIETAAHRFFQPVVREGFVDRPNCTTSCVPMVGGGYPHDIIEVLCATDERGDEATVRRQSATQLDVRRLRPGSAANVVLLMGMGHTPIGMRDSVISLAAWKLLPRVTPDNATSGTVGESFMRFVVGGVGGAATSLPEVNAFIDEYGFKDYLVR